MPEIKNTFTSGKMNKDLDERLIQPGEYRDALNVGIGRSEGSDVGAVENLLGNQLVGPGTSPVTGGTRTVTTTTTTGVSNPSGLYTVVTYSSAGENPSLVIEQRIAASSALAAGQRMLFGDPSSPNIADTAVIATITDLGTGRGIGGVPRQLYSLTLEANPTGVTIVPVTTNAYQVQSTTSTSTDEVTVVAPTVIGSVRDQNTDRIYFFVDGPDHDSIFEFTQSTGDIVPLLRGDLNFSTNNLITGVNIIEDFLFWTDDRNEPRKINVNKWRNDANNNVIPTQIYGRNFQERDITVIRPHPTERITVDTTTDVESETPPFEDVFPQFGYRWKYDDGEYTPFSFFTEEVFIPAPYDVTEHYKEGYNKAVRNIVSSITLSNVPKGGPDVVQIDILYRESISTTIYTLKSIRRDDEEYGDDPSYIDPYVITKRSFYSAVPANQLLRHYDDVPRLAKAQEITANRLVYGNYLQNYQQPASADIIVTQRDHEDTNGLSVKGNRDYEIGVAYIDQFGRQGGLLNGDSIYTTQFSTEATQRLNARITSPAPSWATHYKYFVKESSMDHHNVVAYNTFNDGEAAQNNSEFMWLQFPSDDRNKISEDTFLVPRRHTHGDIATQANTNGVDERIDSTITFNANYGSRGRVNGPRRIIWDGEQGVRNGDRNQNGQSMLSGGAFTAPVDGDYTFVFSGQIVFQGRNRRRWGGRAFLELGAGFQLNTGSGFPTDATVESEERLDRIHAPGTPKVTPFAVRINATLSAGDQLKPLVVRRNNRDKGYVNVTLENVRFRSLVTPVDESQPAPPLELPGVCMTEYSRHKVLDIENEAPDIVRAQLPVDLRRLGGEIQYDASSGNENNRAFLVQSFGQPDAEDADGYSPASTTLYYRAKNSGQGFLNATLFSALNRVLDFEGLERLIINTGMDAEDTDQGDRIISVDVSEVEGGIFLGVGPDNILAETGVEGKVRVNEIAVGWGVITPGDDNTDANNHERTVVRFTLDSAVGVDPQFANFALFKGDVTENALKNLQGSFFVKVPRATNTNELPFLPTGQSVFDGENNVTTLQSIWFETLPLGEDSNLNLYWESTESLPISRHGMNDELDFFNCVAITDNCVFIETQRIFDRFNTQQITKGLRVNVPQEDYSEERKSAGMIYSGLYNSRTGINRTNEFISAEGIRKDLEPNYGSIQKLYTRDTNVIVFCEDKVFQVLADKDLLYNANGGGNVSASAQVLGQTTPFTGEYGISQNPESFAFYGSRVYFADRARGVVLRLSQNGIEEISRYGMSDYFRDQLRALTGPLWGSFDDYHNQYHLRLNSSTTSFDDDVQGWPSRKSFLHESGLTLNNMFYTFRNGQMWVHNSRRVPRNNFYGQQYCSSVTTVFNQEPSTIKNYKTINYEGTRGWTAPLILTDQEAGRVASFVNKEGKWFECIGALNDSAIVGVINDLRGDGVEDFFDDDAVDDGDFGSDEFYDFGDNGDDDGDGMSMGLGDVDEMMDGDGNPVDDMNDPDQPESVNVTIEVIIDDE